MPRLSAGLLMYRLREGKLQVFLAHPGGPFYTRKDDGYWTIPKGEPDPDEDLLEAAKREFEEETGIVPTGPFIPLTPVKQKGGKIVHAWAFEDNFFENQAVVTHILPSLSHRPPKWRRRTNLRGAPPAHSDPVQDKNSLRMAPKGFFGIGEFRLLDGGGAPAYKGPRNPQHQGLLRWPIPSTAVGGLRWRRASGSPQNMR